MNDPRFTINKGIENKYSENEIAYHEFLNKLYDLNDILNANDVNQLKQALFTYLLKNIILDE